MIAYIPRKKDKRHEREKKKTGKNDVCPVVPLVSGRSLCFAWQKLLILDGYDSIMLVSYKHGPAGLFTLIIKAIMVISSHFAQYFIQKIALSVNLTSND